MTSFLRGLTANQQVSLLFVLLFGFLTLATATLLVLSMRERIADAATPATRGLRLKDYQGLLRTSWLMALVFWLGWAAGGGVATALFAMVSFFTLREFISLSPTRRGDHRSLLLAFFVVLPLQYLLVWTERFDLFTVFIPVYVFLAIPTVGALGNDPPSCSGASWCACTA
jgi:phosphatidate cytidylyltransferase